MQAGLRVPIDETQTEITAPHERLTRLTYAWVVNNTGGDVYLSVWSGTGTARTAAERVAGPWLVPDGSAKPVLFEMQSNARAVIAAHTAADLTGAPASVVDFVPVWSA